MAVLVCNVDTFIFTIGVQIRGVPLNSKPISPNLYRGVNVVVLVVLEEGGNGGHQAHEEFTLDRVVHGGCHVDHVEEQEPHEREDN